MFQAKSNKKNDQLTWFPDNTRFSVKSFETITTPLGFEPRLEAHMLDFKWQNKSPLKAKLLVWFLALDKLKNGSYLHQLGGITFEQAQYPLRYSDLETDFHFVFLLSFCLAAWMEWCNFWGVYFVLPRTPLLFIESW